MINKIPRNFYFVGIVFILGLTLGFYASYLGLGESGVIKDISPFREKDSGYSFINPLLFYETPNNNKSGEFSLLVRKVGSAMDNFTWNNEKRKISFYYRDLNHGRWVGINEDEKYTPASLLKVVVMIAYFKEAESKPNFLSNKIVFSKEISELIGSIPYDEGTTLKVGQAYPVNDLINKMIIDSDNGATYALISRIDDDSLAKIYKDLGLKNPGDVGREYTISVQDYAPFFRILYNATYLNREMSERALDLLSQTNFQDGIAASPPRSIKIAHKYGETVSVTGEQIDFIELHDCGIVYHPLNPYLLCIMSRGENLDILSATIKNISASVYDFVSTLPK